MNPDELGYVVVAERRSLLTKLFVDEKQLVGVRPLDGKTYLFHDAEFDVRRKSDVDQYGLALVRRPGCVEPIPPCPQSDKDMVHGGFFCCLGVCHSKRYFYKFPANHGVSNIWKHLAIAHDVPRPSASRMGLGNTQSRSRDAPVDQQRVFYCPTQAEAINHQASSPPPEGDSSDKEGGLGEVVATFLDTVRGILDTGKYRDEVLLFGLQQVLSQLDLLLNRLSTKPAHYHDSSGEKMPAIERRISTGFSTADNFVEGSVVKKRKTGVSASLPRNSGNSQTAGATAVGVAGWCTRATTRFLAEALAVPPTTDIVTADMRVVEGAKGGSTEFAVMHDLGGGVASADPESADDGTEQQCPDSVHQYASSDSCSQAEVEGLVQPSVAMKTLTYYLKKKRVVGKNSRKMHERWERVDIGKCWFAESRLGTQLFNKRVKCDRSFVCRFPERFLEACRSHAPRRSDDTRWTLLEQNTGSTALVECLHEGEIFDGNRRSEREFREFLLDGCRSLDSKLNRKSKVAYLFAAINSRDTEPQNPIYIESSEDVARAASGGGMLAMAMFPMNPEGVWIQLWPAPGMGRLVFIPAGLIVFFRGDYIHGVGLTDNDAKGNPYGRLHLHVNRAIGEHKDHKPTTVKDPLYEHDISVVDYSIPEPVAI